MKEKVLLFDKEIIKLNETGWPYETIYANSEKGIYLVDINIPTEIVGIGGETQ